ncbi:HMG box protein [Sarocladium implicatum]|nr:HMG box protein [Sarocladium implicatum]
MTIPGCDPGDSAKAMARGTISYLEAEGLPVNKSAIFRHFGLSRSQGYAALNLPSLKRNDPGWEETRGRPSKITDEDQQRMETVLWDERYQDTPLSWTSLAEHAAVTMTCNTRTMHRTLGTLGYRRCLNCGRSVAHKKSREKRVEYARRMLEAYPQPQDWRFVRFSGEIHFGFSLDGRMRVIPRAGEKTSCPGCAPQEEEADSNTQWPRDARRLHAWVAVGCGFKSDLVFYEDSTSPNCSGAITMGTYRDKILDKTVKSWITAQGAGSFVLEEDADTFAHGGLSKVNEAQEWKQENGLRYYFNCGDSPDLSPLDSLWPPLKQWQLAKETEWKDEELKQAARDAWADFGQGRLDMWVDLMQQRLRQVIDGDGHMVNW